MKSVLLQKFDTNSSDFPYLKYLLSARSMLMNKYKMGIMHSDNFSVPGLIKNMLTFKRYTIAKKLLYFKGSLFSMAE